MEEKQLDFTLPLLSVKHNRQQSVSSNKSIDQPEYAEMKSSATVPFHWEQIPGKPKQEVGIHVQATEEPSNIQTLSLKVPPGRESGPFVNHNIFNLNCEDESDSKSDDDCYSVNKRSRDVMMDGFSPAVKDVVLETTEYVVEKPSVVNEHCSEYGDNGGSEEEQRSLVPVTKSGKSWGIIARFCAKNYLCLSHKLPGTKGKLHSSPRNAQTGPLEKDLPQIENKRILDEPPLKSPIFDGLYKKLQYHNGNNLKSDFQRQFDPSSLIPPLPKSPSESWLWRTIVKTSNLEGLIPDASDEQNKP